MCIIKQQYNFYNNKLMYSLTHTVNADRYMIIYQYLCKSSSKFKWIKYMITGMTDDN